ncbi:hypothetical protein [Paracoccus sp. (in: a-proteobacteria)]|uniref:hypothetical protein n=1 Tax=Paracoccus sp. TaxID=267 RepID=UPI002AFE29C3|nr:hypothetical protein [Paracoccus sp. (in: a-proteobacteria)]
METSYHTLAFGVTEQELISEELRIVIPGCEVREVREVSEGRWEAGLVRATTRPNSSAPAFWTTPFWALAWTVIAEQRTPVFWKAEGN